MMQNTVYCSNAKRAAHSGGGKPRALFSISRVLYSYPLGYQGSPAGRDTHNYKPVIMPTRHRERVSTI